MILTLPFSLLFTFLIIYLEKRLKLFTDDVKKEHAIHNIPTPKCGGIGIYLTFILFSYYFNRDGFYMALSGLPLFLYGIYEDANGNTPQKIRLAIMVVTTFLTIYLTGYYVNDIGLFKLPKIVAIFFTIFAVVGITSAINFIDGLNGLASGVCLITLIFYGGIAYSLLDTHLLNFLLIFIFSITGFFILNFPWGKIFLGDAGAYFIGYLIAFSSIMLVNRHPEISPWYPLAALSYPIIETLVTIKRRLYKKKNKRIPFFQSEKVHLHTLLFKRKTRRNPLAAFYLLIFHLCINIAAYIFRRNMLILIILFLIVIVIYFKWYSTMFIKKNRK